MMRTDDYNEFLLGECPKCLEPFHVKSKEIEIHTNCVPVKSRRSRLKTMRYMFLLMGFKMKEVEL